MIITIDGPSASGKSTVARALAGRLGFQFLNTGAMYRAIAWKCLAVGTDLDEESDVAAIAEQAEITFPDQVPHLDGRDVSAELRTESVSRAASRIALNARVRAQLVGLQRRSAAGGRVVTEGRDQGTIVFPDAAFKIFLTASAETRAARRLAELAAIEGAPPSDVSYEGILAQIRDRDERDAQRPLAPLRPAEDAIVLDSTHLSVDQTVDRIAEMVGERFPREGMKAEG